MTESAARPSLMVNTIPLRGPLTGVARYAMEIASRLPGLAPDMRVVFFNGVFSRGLRTDVPFASKTRITLKTFHKRCIRSSLYLSLRALHAGLLLGRRFDLCFEPNHIPMAGVRCKFLATTVHDLSVARFPQWHPEKRRRYFHSRFDVRTPRSDVIITVSEFVRHEVMEYFNLPSERVRAIPNGLDHGVFYPRPEAEQRDMRARFGIDGPFLLFAGSIEPRKNILGALTAYAALPERLKQEFRFVLCGFEGWRNAEVMEIIRREKDRVVYLGYPDDHDLARLYSAASAFVFPSFYEGFGLPPLEAMACGAPVIVSRTSSLPEVCGDAASYADPADLDSIASAMEATLDNEALRTAMSRAGVEQAAKFSWDRSASLHMELFRSMLGKGT